MKMKRSWLTPLLIAICSLALLNCSGGGGNEAEEDEDNESDAVASDGTLSAVADGSAASLGSLGGNPSLSGLLAEGSSTDSGAADYNCTPSNDNQSITCGCPLGGTATYTLENPVTIQQSIEFDHTVTIDWDQCASSACNGEEVVVDGQVTGTLQGTVSFDAVDITANMRTAEQCAGIQATHAGETKDVGFDITMRFDGSNEPSASGTYCEDDVITFNSLDELKEIVDPDMQCSDG